MKHGRVVLALLALVSTQIAAQEDYNAGMCPTTPKLGDNPSKRYWLDGSIGESPVRIYLDPDADLIVVTFSYPASWRLETSNDGVKVTCPNPSFMAYESYDIEFRQGKQSELADLGFHLIETKWMHGEDCDKTPSACSFVPVRRREGMTI